MVPQESPRFPIFVIVKLAVIGWFIHHFHLEVAFNLPLLFPLVGVAFAVHAAVPLELRRWVFLLATAVGIVMVLPWVQAGLLVSLGLALIGITQLPIGFRWRQLLMLIIAAGLAAIRLGLWPVGIGMGTLTLLGSLFMFRMLLFLYELKHQKERVPWLTQVSYFFMLPNVIFPLFPVVDYKTFQRQYYDAPSLDTYRRGVYLIAKAVLFLYAYRLLYSFVLPTEAQVHTLPDLVAYLAFGYGLTLRLAGIYHFSVGVLHLFGYRLPDVFQHHFFATGFADLWRRINIYWKDFVVKLYFNPLYFRFKKLGTQRAIFMATLLAFAITLLLHSYQTLWLAGIFRVTLQDVVFWGAFGVIIAVGGLLKGRPKQQSKRSEGSVQDEETPRTAARWRGSFRQAGKILLTFSFMSLLWSFWTSARPQDWFDLMQGVTATPGQVGALVLGLGVVWGVGAGLIHRFGELPSGPQVGGRRIEMAGIWGILVALPLIFNSFTLDRFWRDCLAGDEIQSLFHFTLRDEDSQNEVAGYYDNILTTSDLMSPMADDLVSKSKLFQLHLYQNGILYDSEDGAKRRWRPSSRSTFQDVEIATNSAGMYDQEYAQQPEDGVLRIAFLGASIEMGWALPWEQGLDKQVERILVEAEIDSVNRVEILNFSVPSRVLINHAYVLPEVLAYAPDWVVIFDHDEVEMMSFLRGCYAYDYSQDFGGYLDSIYQSGRLQADQPVEQQLAALEPYREPLMRQLMQGIQADCQALDIKTSYVAMPELRVGGYARQYNHLELAAAEGFHPIDLSGLFAGEAIPSLTMDGPGHPTAEANARIAQALAHQLLALLHQNP